MYNVSSAYKTAIANGAQQRFLMLFDNEQSDGKLHPMFITNEDIDIDAGGLRFTEIFSDDEDLTIGGTPSSELSFTIYNDEGQYTDFEFGEAKAYMGVKIGTSALSTNTDALCVMISYATTESQSATFCGYSTFPYMKAGSNTFGNVTHPVYAIIGWKDYLLLFDITGTYTVLKRNAESRTYKVSTDVVIGDSIKMMGKHLANRRETAWFSDTGYINQRKMYTIRESRDTNGNKNWTQDVYEFCPLGVFDVERPNCVNVCEMEIDCFDAMQRFEKDITDITITYPITIINLLKAICDSQSVPCTETSFINSTAVISSQPNEFKSSTMRTVLGWIAEASCSIAKIDRDGIMRMKWFSNHTATEVYDEHKYEEFNPYYYTVPNVDKVVCRNDGKDKTEGTGDNGYLILNNPLLKNATVTGGGS